MGTSWNIFWLVIAILALMGTIYADIIIIGNAFLAFASTVCLGVSIGVLFTASYLKDQAEQKEQREQELD